MAWRMNCCSSKRVLVLGIAPLPEDNTTKIHGSCMRTLQFIDPLLEEGHIVHLVAMRITGLEESFQREVRVQKGNLTYISVDEVACFRSDEYLQCQHDEFQPDCIIGVNAFPSTRAVQLRTQCPVWADINGYSMGEAQTKAYREGDDLYVGHNWNQQKPALERADKFSSASDLQRHILVGELGTVGRLNRYTMGYNFVHTVPEGRKETPIVLTDNNPRWTEFRPEDFLVLWSGGYNLWCDVDTMFAGLERAMAQESRIHFVSTGGIIDGVDEKTYPHFQEMVSRSQFSDRFHLKGWIPFEQVPDYFLCSDIGINVDAQCYESMYGARNRITDMMRAGLPILTTLGTEISRLVGEAQCGLTFPIGNAEALSEALLYAAHHSDEMRLMGNAGKDYFQKYYTFRETIKPVLQWVSSPSHAPDWGKPKPLQEPPQPVTSVPTSQTFWHRVLSKFKEKGYWA